MKKLMVAICAFAAVLTLSANEEFAGKEVVRVRDQPVIWPAFFSMGDLPETPDVVGLRVTIPYSSRQESVTGVDIGLWGRSRYYEGVQLNILRNDVKDFMAGFQVGLYNSVIRSDMIGLQVGLWNETGAFRGLQVGLVNVTGAGQGFQVGIINRAETLNGYQIGVINVIRDAEMVFCPIVNIGF